MAARLALSVLALVMATITLSQALRGPGPKKCCFNFNTKPVHEKRVQSYYTTNQQCSKFAVVLRLKNNRDLCVNPSESWVQELIQRLNNKTSVGAVHF